MLSILKINNKKKSRHQEGLMQGGRLFFLYELWTFWSGDLHVDDDVLHCQRLIADVDNLAAADIVLVIDALGVPPVHVLD